jgi:hypothetical protein
VQPTAPVPRISREAGAVEIKRLLDSHRPAILEGAVDHWPIMAGVRDEAERMRYLVDRVGDNSVSYAELPAKYDGLLSYRDDDSQDPNFRTVKGTFREFCSLIQNDLGGADSRVRYLQSISIAQDFPSLRPELDLALTTELQEKGSPRIWIGNGGQRTATHYDTAHNFACVVAGTKRFMIFPPEQLSNLYLGSMSKTPAGTPVSVVDPRAPDLDKYPRFRKAIEAAVVVEVKAGEVLFLPAYWFHYVETVGPTILINFWWDDVAVRQVSGSWDCFKHALLTIRQLPRERRDIFKSYFDHFVFCQSGDPYAHLPTDKQGWAGALTKQSELVLRAAVESAARKLVNRWTGNDFAWTHRLMVSDSIAFGFRAGRMLVRRRSGGEFALPEPLFELMRRFSEPAIPESVFSQMPAASDPDARLSFEKHLRRFMSEGLLVPAED